MKFENSISIIGGAGHVGLPLSIIFASKGFNVNIIDNDENKLKVISKAKNILGFEAKTSLSEILDIMIPWIKEQINKGTI